MSAPTREQLVNFVAVSAFGPGAGAFERLTVEALLEVPSVREVWLSRHRELQAALSSGDATRPTGDKE